MKNIAILSDTHGLLRSDVLSYIYDVDLIVHAGDIGHIDIIKRLENIAPVVSVKGNNDKENCYDQLHDTEVVQIEGCNLFVLHDLKDIDFDPAAAEFDVVVSGHTHQPSNEIVDGVIYLNPGSIGPKRFSLPTTMAMLSIIDGVISIEIKEFAV